MAFRKRGRFNRRQYKRRGFKRTARRNRGSMRFGARQRKGQARFYFKRTWRGSLNLQAASDANPYLTASQFALGQLPNSSEFTNLFDNYRIHGIRATFFQPAYGITATEMPTYILHTAVDYNDASTPASVQAIQEYPSYKQVILREQFSKNGKVTRFFKPKVLTNVYNSGLSGYQETRTTAISTAYPDVPHYGLKWAIEEYNAQATQPVTQDADITIPYSFTYYMSFGRVK